MSQELVYTSAPKGLKLGSRGFCTVASTTGMAKNLADRLEALTGYKHLFPPDSPQASQNPINYSYLRFSLGGQNYYVLSRIADAGLDYTQRSNKIAHHLVLSKSELVAAGPAWLAMQPGVFETSWSKDPQLLPQGRSIPVGDIEAGVCKTWKAVTGDAGWAGVLAEHTLENASDEAYLIYRPGTDVLRLFLESQSLLPSEVRWNTTFSTYFTKLPPGFECRWKGVVEGTPESFRIRRLQTTLVIDVSKPLLTAPNGARVSIAREPMRVDGSRIDATDHDSASPPMSEQRKYDLSTNRQSTDDLFTAPRHSSVAARPPSLPERSKGSPIAPISEIGISRRERILWITAILIVIAVFTGLIAYLMRPAVSIPSAAKQKANEGYHSSEPRIEESITDEHQIIAARTHPLVERTNPPPPQSAPKTDVRPPADPILNDAPIQPEPVPVPPRQIRLDDILDRDSFRSEIALPPISQSELDNRWTKPVDIMKLASNGPPKLALKLFSQSTEVGIQQVPPSTWRIRSTTNGASVDIAEIVASNDGKLLQFRWLAKARVSTVGTELVRTAALFLDVVDGNQGRFISFLPARRETDAIVVDEDTLVKDGEWTIPAGDMYVPKGQVCTAEILLIGSDDAEVGKAILRPDGHAIIARDIAGAQLDVRFAELSGGIHRVSMALQVVDGNVAISFPDWIRKRVEERRELLRQAIASYADKADQQTLHILRTKYKRLPVTFGEPQRINSNTAETITPLKLGNLTPFLRPMSLNKLVVLELDVRDLLSEQYRRQGGNISEVEVYPNLELHQEMFPDLFELRESVRRQLSSSRIRIRVTRQIPNLETSSQLELPAMEVVVIGSK